MEFVKNDFVDVKITDMSKTGEGIGKADGYTLFVKDAIVGDTVRAKITKAKKNYGFARVEEIIEESEKRCIPRCEHHKRCGGCQIQAMSYDAQLEYKRNIVFNTFLRIGGFDEEFLNARLEDIIGMEDAYRYRNKAQYPIGYDRGGNVVAGFYAGRTHDIIPCEDCVIGITENKQILNIIIEHLKTNKISAYDEKLQKGLVRHVLIRKAFATGRIMVCIVISEKGKAVKTEFGKKIEYIKNQHKLIDSLRTVAGMASISVSINPDNTNVVMGNEIHTIWGEDTIEDILLGRRYRISPLAFYQVNPIQCEKLYKTAIEFADLSGNEEVWDICCGIGTIALSVASSAKLVHGVEIVPQAIDDAKYNAKANEVSNADFVCADATEYLMSNAEKITADVIIVDPPRKGMEEDALNAIVKVSPEKIVYVSCDPATLARDAKYLCDNGYQIERIRPVDMFPHSVHVETVCLLSKLREAKHHVSVKFNMDEMDITSAESKATYEEIKKYVAEHNGGMKVSNLYIAQVKAKYGIIERENYNLPKSEDARQPQCPKEKEDSIMEALKAFQMI